MKWQTQVPGSSSLSQEQKGFSYNYDPLNRLTSAVSQAASSGSNLYNETISYDELGNILTLARKNRTATLNNMTYNYVNPANSTLSNILQTIIDNGTEGLTATYGYNSNGSITSDSHKTTSTSYNELNLPSLITKTSGNETLQYIYDATGRKLERITTIAGTVTENRVYDSGIEYAGTTASRSPNYTLNIALEFSVVMRAVVSRSV